MSTLVIFDLDGCLINDKHRLHLIDWKARNFDAYHDEKQMALDKTLIIGNHLVEYAKGKEYTIAFFTARPEKVREVTARQIKSFFDIDVSNDNGRVLYTRSDDEEGIPSATLKAKMLTRFLRDKKFDKIYAFDDHPDVVRKYCSMGVDAWLVSDKIVCSGFRTEALMSIRKGEKYSVNGLLMNLEFGDYSANYVFLEDNRTKSDQYGSGNNKLIKNLFLSSKILDGRSLELSDYYSKAAIAPVSDPVLDAVRNQQPTKRIAADVLEEAAKTFRERNELYKDNALVVGKVMTALFPNGVRLETEQDYHMWHLFELIIVKLTRFTNSGLTHQDSIHDLTVYAAMIEPLVNSHTIKIK